MKEVTLLDRLYSVVLAEIWFLIELNNKKFNGIVYLPDTDEKRDFLLTKLQHTDHVLTAWSLSEYPESFAKIKARIKPGSYIVDVNQKEFIELCKKYGIYNQGDIVDVLPKHSSRELQKEVTIIFSDGSFGRLEKAILRYLAINYKLKNKDEIKQEIGDCDLGHLLGRVKQKLLKTRLKLVSHKPRHLGDTASYRLEFNDS